MKYIAGTIAAGVLFLLIYFGYFLYVGEYWPNSWWFPIVIGTLIGRVYAGTKIYSKIEYDKQLRVRYGIKGDLKYGPE